tara:strand:+ start:424 stop:756 length:333 start_codon:yes stop_codon:yes gene_type:complete
VLRQWHSKLNRNYSKKKREREGLMKNKTLKSVDKEIKIVIDFVISETTTKKETIQLLRSLRRFLRRHMAIELRDDYWIDSSNIMSMSVSNSEDVTITEHLHKIVTVFNKY